jgi:hypothetical protein
LEGFGGTMSKHHAIRVKNHITESILGSIFGAALISALGANGVHIILFVVLAVLALVGLIAANKADIEEEEEIEEEKNA